MKPLPEIMSEALSALEEFEKKDAPASHLDLYRRMKAALAALVAASGGLRVRHNKRGSSYSVYGTGEVQSSRPIVEGDELTIYRGDDSKFWLRPVDEFEDGRFTAIQADTIEVAPQGPSDIEANDEYRQDWMNDAQWECVLFLRDLFLGFHHISGTIRSAGEKGVSINTTATAKFATYDSDLLTRAVLMAHDRCIRFKISPSGPTKLHLELHKRYTREGSLAKRHPTIEQAVEAFRPSLQHYASKKD